MIFSLSYNVIWLNFVNYQCACDIDLLHVFQTYYQYIEVCTYVTHINIQLLFIDEIMYYMANVFGFGFPTVIDVFLFRLVRFCHPAHPVSDNFDHEPIFI